MLVWRLGVFLYVLLYIAVRSSYGSINHGNYYYLYVSFALLFLPKKDKQLDLDRRGVLSSLAVLWLTQSLLLFPYSLAGLWKILYSRLDVISPDGMTRILLGRALDDVDGVAPLLPLVAHHEQLLQLMLIVTVYVQFFALLAVFRPHLHRPIGAVLMLFHVGSAWLMNISFSANILMLGLFLVLSPTAPARFSLHGLLQSLPIIGIPFRYSGWRGSVQGSGHPLRAWLIYDGECPLCVNYARYLRLREAVGELILVNARDGGPLVDEVRNLAHNLDEGMVLKMDGRYYIGHQALNVLARLSDKHDIFNRLNGLLFSSPQAARIGYPVLKMGRRLLLRIKGVSPLDHRE